LQQHIGVLELPTILLGIGDEVRRKISRIELLAFDDSRPRLQRLASSTVMTPSLADLLHGLRDHLADLAVAVRRDGADLAISAEEPTILARFSMSFTTALTAKSMPRFSPWGHAGGDDLRLRARWHAPARFAVVVPSPAWSLVFCATSRTIWAPIFSNLSSSSISLRHRHAVLGDARAPKLLSSTTLRPLGAEGHPYRIGQDIDAAQHPVAAHRTRILLPCGHFV